MGLWSQQRLGTALTAIAAREKAGDVACYDRRRLVRELGRRRRRAPREGRGLLPLPGSLPTRCEQVSVRMWRAAP